METILHIHNHGLFTNSQYWVQMMLTSLVIKQHNVNLDSNMMVNMICVFVQVQKQAPLEMNQMTSTLMVKNTSSQTVKLVYPEQSTRVTPMIMKQMVEVQLHGMVLLIYMMVPMKPLLRVQILLAQIPIMQKDILIRFVNVVMVTQ